MLTSKYKILIARVNEVLAKSSFISDQAFKKKDQGGALDSDITSSDILMPWIENNRLNKD